MNPRATCHAAALDLLERSLLYLGSDPVGTVASVEPGEEKLNYDHCFVRDFAVSALALLAQGRSGIVRRFLLELLHLQSRESSLHYFRPGAGLMPASFSLGKDADGQVQLQPDFGQNSIARVTPVDSGFWWLLLLRAHRRATGETDLGKREDVQTAIERLVSTWLADRFEMLPTILVPDAASMIDRRMGVFGHPLDVEVLFFAALRAAAELLRPDSALHDEVTQRLGHLAEHLRRDYWLDLGRLESLHRYESEQFGPAVDNRFNIQPESIPLWLMDWLPRDAGYFVGNLGPSRLDFRFFAQGNLLACFTGLAEKPQTQKLLRLYELREGDLLGEMPLKIAFPAVAGRDWELLTGFDPKNTPWSYHNGGNWPFAIWLFAATCRRAGRQDLIEKSLDRLAGRLERDRFPEYYDGPKGRLIGRRARLQQTWSAAGYLIAEDLLDSDQILDWIGWRDVVPGVAGC